MPWFMDTMPDGDMVHEVARSYQDAHANYLPHLQRTQTALSETLPAWSGAGSDAHSQAVALTQQHATEHAGWLVALANVFYVLGTLLKIIFVLQMAWLVIQAGTVLIGILTMGVGVLEGEGAAAAMEAVITALRQAISSMLQALARSLMASLTKLAIGGAAGGLVGLGVGINTVETNHLSGWQAVLTLGGDTFTGAGVGATIATNPYALLGTGIGIGQVTTQAALGNPTTAQDAFNLLAFDTMAAGSAISADDFANPSTDDPYAGDSLATGKGDARSYNWNKDGEGAFNKDDTLPYQPDGVKNARIGQNYEGSCASASSRIILNDNGVVVSEQEMMQAAGIDPIKGGYVRDLPGPIQDLGGPVGAYSDSYTIGDLEAATANGQSAIVSVNPTGFTHALVVDGVINTDAGPMVLIRDPLPYGFQNSGSAYMVPLDVFEKAWSGKGIFFAP